MGPVTLFVSYHCKPGMARPFVRAVKDAGIQRAVREEAGCLQYDYHLSCETEDTVVLLERWADAAALERHAAQPTMDALRALKETYVEQTRVERFP